MFVCMHTLLYLVLNSVSIGMNVFISLLCSSFLQRYLTSHQQNVTVILSYLVQACHEQVKYRTDLIGLMFY